MTLADKVADIAARMPSVSSQTAVFVRREGTQAVVSIGTNTVSIPLAGWSPPVPGMVVQVEWRNGRPLVTGPAATLNEVGVITGTGSPRATVTVDDEEYLLYMRAGYTPTLGDTVTIDWTKGIIEGAVTGLDDPDHPDTPAPAPKAFSGLVVRAVDSGRYQTSWWGKDPWASTSNDGIWVYLSRLRDALKGANVTRTEIFLPLQQELGLAQIGLHSHSSIPAGAPSIGSLVDLPLGQRSGWQLLPASWGNWLRDNTGGIGVHAPGGSGFSKWAGVNIDSLSGALRFSGTR